LLILWSRRDRVAALRLIAVFSSKPNIDVLAGEVSRPIRAIEHETSDARRFAKDASDFGDAPDQSP
jgi:hypothetical protein